MPAFLGGTEDFDESAPAPIGLDDPLHPKPKPPSPAPAAAGHGPAVGLAPAPAPAAAPKPVARGAAPAARVPPSAYGNMPSSVPPPTVAPPGAPVDRVKLATETFGNLAGQRQEQFDADARDEVRRSAALGQIASGGLRTRYGDLRLARDRDLDTLQRDLSLKAAEGSIADATTAYQQSLAGAQHGLAEKIGLAGIDTQKGALALERDKFGLAKEGQTAGIEQQKAALALQEKLGLGGLSAEQQRIAIAQKQQELDDKYNAGKMTLAERDAARADLALAQQNANTQAQIGIEKERLGIAKGAQDIANQVALGQLSLAQAAAKLDEKVKLGQLTLAEKQQALAELTQSQNQGNEQQKIQLAKAQLEQQGKQFGLSLAQSKELATLADKTQNRQIDVTTAQGKNALLLELARIMGAKDLSGIDPSFLAAIAKSLGVALPPTTSQPPVGTPPAPEPPPGNDSATPTGDGFLP